MDHFYMLLLLLGMGVASIMSSFSAYLLFVLTLEALDAIARWRNR